MNENDYEARTENFKVYGQNVGIMSPTSVRVTIHCPWGRNEPVTPERQAFVMNQTQSVVNYMLAEGIIVNGGTDVGIMVETEHHPVKG